MTAILAQRQLALLGAALLGAVVALAVASRDDSVAQRRSLLPLPAVSNVSGWYPALAGVRQRPLAGHASGCGTLLTPKTLGVDHQVLPCGAKIFVTYRGKTVLTSVVDRGPFTPRFDFEVTPALAELLGLSGVQTIRWSFARAA
ncbi:MAG: RlpA-like double-psi beta-barrel domain-containing protein [Verrucomicrobiota bacterium]